MQESTESGVPPQAPCNEKRRPTGLFLLETLNDEGYAQWKPKIQEKTVSFDVIEKELGFPIHPQIKEYFSTYWFLGLEAMITHDNIVGLNDVIDLLISKKE